MPDSKGPAVAWRVWLSGLVRMCLFVSVSVCVCVCVYVCVLCVRVVSLSVRVYLFPAILDNKSKCCDEKGGS